MLPAASEAQLVESLTDKDPDVRKDAARALVEQRCFGALARAGEAAVPPLVECLCRPIRTDADAAARSDAASVLGSIGAAKPALVDCLTDEDVWVRAYAAMALKGPWVIAYYAESMADTSKGKEVALAALTELLEHQDEAVRTTAHAAIAELQKEEAPASAEDEATERPPRDSSETTD